MGIITQFVKDRLKETRWKDREYIYDLGYLERIIEKGKPEHYPEALLYHDLCRRYPVEAMCIRKEIREGIYISPEEFRELLKEYRRCKRLTDEMKRQKWEQERREREEEEWKNWIMAGGRP